ncbi:hypothetical protein GCM10011515_17370 [Tsuneonella deserti]|uniref:DUF429 domain-containing protein n=1 Tax=Tsuneonella deserti TaxID=2035528 RepID=A0ABQ1SAV3_9SPHN|nr:hypothetical protein [Tsuneonella deserti]GGD98102.1 hypothetical protein GCM10011515_17370 [Tsuneonella deserti]
MSPDRFRHFAAIDWSGAAGERHAGIAVALCRAGESAPRIVRPGHRWSRAEVRDWIAEDMPPETLVGLDISGSLAFEDAGAYFPGWEASPGDARALWALVEDFSATDPHLSAGSFVDHPEIARHYRRHGGREGDLFGGGIGRLRVTERTGQTALGCRPTSNFNLVGASQVGKASLTGMRVLHRLDGHIALWPYDPLPERGHVAVEIYTTIAAIAAGRPASRSKLRTFAELNAALSAIGSKPVRGSGPIDDHRSDALLAAAWLRTVAHDARYWQPAAMTEGIARTEGWTFGAL